MNELITHCPNCGEDITFNSETNECVITCPKCGKRLHVQIIDGKSYAIDENLYQIGDKLPANNKKDRWITFCNWFITFWNRCLGIPPKVKIATAIILALAIICPVVYSIITAPEAIEKTIAYSNSESLWNEFREANPYNVQLVGLKSYEDGSHTIIISEPDEEVSTKKLNKLFKKYNACIRTFQQPLGYDGWLKDAVISFNDIKDSQLETLKSELFKLLYGTDYKSFFYDLSEMPHHVEYAFETLNYQVSDEELKMWVVDSDEHFINSDNTINNTFNQLMSTSGPTEGVFYSDSPGLVAWVISKGKITPEVFKVNARMFSLDSDLILGAFKKSNKIAIIGKERTSPLNELPPMRISTILMLASTTEKELSQSYERNNFFAGKLPGGKDYAPILLSDELWHTEYGSILNITDQMLKSWSQNADIHYEGFNYPEPIDWAFEKGAYQDLEANTLTYNWNTSGAGYIVEASDDCPYDIFAVNRTGSLPVSYIPGDSDEIDENDQTYKAEELAYDFFSNLSNPELVKVNQYASLYQIFSNFEIAIPRQANYHPVTTNQLDQIMGSIIQELKTFKSNKNLQDSVRVYIAEKEPEEFGRMAESPYIDEDTKLSLLITLLFTDYEKEADTTIDNLKRISQLIENFRFKPGTPSEEKYNKVGHYFINPREIDYDEVGWLIYYWDNLNQLRKDNDIPISNTYNINGISVPMPNSRYVSDADLRNEMVEKSTIEDMYMFNAYQLLQHIDLVKTFNTAMSFCSLTESKEVYLSENVNSSNQWIKCPTIVQSWSVMDSVARTGGHNLNSRVTPVKVDPKLKQGTYRIEEVAGKKTMVISPTDRGVSPSVLRLAERTNKAGEFKYTKAQSLRARPRKVVLAATEKRSSRGFNVADHIKITEEKIGFKIGDKHVETMDELFAELHLQLQKEAGGGERALTFENVNERTVRLVSEDLEKPVYLDKGKATRAKRGSFEMGKVECDYSRSEEGVVIVKVPIRSEQANVRSRLHIFEVPKQYLELFLERLKVFLKDIDKEWNFKSFKRTLDGSEIDIESIKETEQYMVAQVMFKLKESYYVKSIQEKTA